MKKLRHFLGVVGLAVVLALGLSASTVAHLFHDSPVFGLGGGTNRPILDLDFTHDDFGQLNAALCIAAASYLDAAETVPLLHNRDKAGKDANSCYDLAGRITRHLATGK